MFPDIVRGVVRGSFCRVYLRIIRESEGEAYSEPLWELRRMALRSAGNRGVGAPGRWRRGGDGGGREELFVLSAISEVEGLWSR